MKPPPWSMPNRRQSTNTADGAAQPFAQYIYSHDKQGNLREIDESYPAGTLTNRIVLNSYDKTYRLVNESISTASETTVTAYQYDNGHNRIQKSVTTGGTTSVSSYTYGDGSTASTANSNQLVSFTEGSNTVSFGYDANGNRATRTENSQTDTYSYDYENRLLGFNKLNGADTGNHSWAYDYRTRRVEFDKAGGSSTTSFSFSGGTSIQEYASSSSTPDVEFIRGSDYGGGIGGILYSLRGSVPSVKHYNSRGDVVAATDASGSLTWQSQYEAFGTITAENGSTLDRQKSNTKDQDLANYANEGFRWRDLETGMFFQRDPAGFIDGPNVYTYVVQNPWTKFDPLGLFEMSKRPEDVMVTERVKVDDSYTMSFQRPATEAEIDAMINQFNGVGSTFTSGLQSKMNSTLDGMMPDASDPKAKLDLTVTALADASVGRALGIGSSKLSPQTATKATTPGGPTAKNIADEGVDLQLKMKEGWTPQQQAAAQQKAEALTAADTTVVKNPQRSSNLRGRFKKAGGEVDSTQDVDHTVDLQLNGADDVLTNTNALDRSVNRSMGAQIQHQIKDLPEGTVVNDVTIQ